MQGTCLEDVATTLCWYGMAKSTVSEHEAGQGLGLTTLKTGVTCKMTVRLKEMQKRRVTGGI